MIYRNEATGQLVRVYRTSTNLLEPSRFEQENVLTGDRSPLTSLDCLKLVQDAD